MNCKSCICQTCLRAIDDNGPTQFFGEGETQNSDDDNENSHQIYYDKDSNDEDILETPNNIDGDYLLNGMYSYNLKKKMFMNLYLIFSLSFPL